MDTVEKIHILCLLDSVEIQYFEELFSGSQIELCQEMHDDVSVIIAESEVQNTECKILYISDNKDLFPRVSPNLISGEIAKTSIKRFCGLESSVHIDSLVDGELRSFKISDPFSMGHYLDVFSSTVYKRGFDLKEAQSIYTSTLSWLMNSFDRFPIECDFIYSENLYVLQFHFALNKLNVKSDIIIEQLKMIEGTIIDCYYLKSSKRFAVSITKMSDTQEVGLLFHGPQKFNNLNTDRPASDNLRSHLALSKEDVTYQAARESSGSVTEIIKSVISFLKERDRDENFDIIKELKDYPDQEDIAELSSEDIEYIKKTILKNQISSEPVAKFQSLLEQIDKPELVSGDEELEGGLAHIVSGGVELDEINRVEGVTEEIKDDSIRVKGSGEGNISEEINIVKGSDLEPQDDESVVIKGVTEHISDEKWTTLKSQVVDNLKEYIDANKPLDEIRSYMNNALVNTLGFDEQKSAQIVEAILPGEEIGTELNQEKSPPIENDHQEISRLKQQNSENLVKMRRLMSLVANMKKQIVAYREAEVVSQKSLSELSDPGEQINNLKSKLISSIKNSKSQEYALRQLQNKFETEVKDRDHKIELLEQKYNDEKVRASKVLNENAVDEREIAKLENDKSKLQTLLDRLSASYDQVMNECDNLKTKLVNLQEGTISIEQYNLERARTIELETKLAQLNKENTTRASSSDDSVQVDSSELEKKLKESEASKKALQLEIKKHSQKIKIMTSQMRELEKKKKGPKSAKTQAGGVNDAKLKHAEKSLEQMRELKDKALADLADRKREAHLAKQENSVLQNKIQELEKKLSKFDKKAA